VRQGVERLATEELAHPIVSQEARSPPTPEQIADLLDWVKAGLEEALKSVETMRSRMNLVAVALPSIPPTPLPPEKEP
jgi:hypothetical protein